MTKVVAITQRISFVSEYGEERESLDTKWYNFFSEVQNTVLVPISYKHSPEAFFECFSVDCLVLSGGNDVIDTDDFDSERASEIGSNAARSLSRKRDKFERSLVDVAISKNIPILGVCRGLQLLALRYGAKLLPVTGHVGQTHSLTRFSSTQVSTFGKRLLSCLIKEDGSLIGDLVNSYHNFGVAMHHPFQEGAEVILLAPCQDVVEAFVHERHDLAAVMWHPERSTGAAWYRDVHFVQTLFKTTGVDVCAAKETILSQAMDDTRFIALCAGQGTRLRPLTNEVPKCMVKYKGRCIIDYTLSAVHSCNIADVTLVTGYKADVLKRPGVKYVHNQHYMSTNMVYSLFCALGTLPSSSKKTDTVVSYSDIIFYPSILEALLKSSGYDVYVVIDKDWLNLWKSRMEDPLSDAETLKIDGDGLITEIGKKPLSYDCIEGQYIGLMKFSPTGLERLSEVYGSLDRNAFFDGKDIDNMYMTSLLQLLINAGVKVCPVYIQGGWIEVDSVEDLKCCLDVSRFPSTYKGQMANFGTKAETLQSLRDLEVCKVLPMEFFSLSQWEDVSTRTKLVSKCLSMLASFTGRLIVRSSARSEDSSESSSAGLYTTIKDVLPDHKNIERAVENVFLSYGESQQKDDQVLVQPMLVDVTVCGVLCTTELQGYLPYYVISYEEGGGTDAVTSGTTANFKTMYILKEFPAEASLKLLEWQEKLIQAAKELQFVFASDKLDIEFAITKEGNLNILQVRPVVLSKHVMADETDSGLKASLVEAQAELSEALHGEEILDNMMDWNPAEMIGVSPAPLARSLYEVLITDQVAMRSRAMLGYRDVSNKPLMCDIAGRTFIKASISFESFIPAALSDELARKLTSYYLAELRKFPERRDKVEFEIAFTCFVPNLQSKLSSLRSSGFSDEEQENITSSLLHLTKNIFSQVDDDTATVATLPLKVKLLRDVLDEKDTQSATGRVKDKRDMISKLLAVTKEFGTLPFANLARAAFVAVSLLRALVESEHLTNAQYCAFMESLETVSKELSSDLLMFREGRLEKEDFLKRYGHLRPGTYDICTSRYDENFDLYFPDCSSQSATVFITPGGGDEQLDVCDDVRGKITEYLSESGLNISFEGLLTFCKKAIEGRERAKFIFTAAVSEVISEVKALGDLLNIHAFDMSFADVKHLCSLSTASNIATWENIHHNRQRMQRLGKLKLPATIFGVDDLYSHHESAARANFVTTKVVTGAVVGEADLFSTSLRNKIIVVESADPGWDWLFSNQIGGLITCFGGANSHMAIRAAELSLPAAIGVGETTFKRCCRAQQLQLNASSQTINVL